MPQKRMYIANVTVGREKSNNNITIRVFVFSDEYKKVDPCIRKNIADWLKANNAVIKKVKITWMTFGAVFNAE